MDIWPWLAPNIIWASAEKTSGGQSQKNKQGPEPEKQAGAKARKTSGGQSQKNKEWPMLKILRDHIMNHHMVAAAEGGRHHVVIHYVVP